MEVWCSAWPDVLYPGNLVAPGLHLLPRSAVICALAPRISARRRERSTERWTLSGNRVGVPARGLPGPKQGRILSRYSACSHDRRACVSRGGSEFGDYRPPLQMPRRAMLPSGQRVPAPPPPPAAPPPAPAAAPPWRDPVGPTPVLVSPPAAPPVTAPPPVPPVAAPRSPRRRCGIAARPSTRRAGPDTRRRGS